MGFFLGCGKTTIIKKLLNEIQTTKDISVAGFFTEEVRENKERIGFDVETSFGERTSLARVTSTCKFSASKLPKMGKYSVFIQEFSNLVVPVMKRAEDTQSLLIIDEVGKMELLSKEFVYEIEKLKIAFNNPKNIRKLIVTVPLVSKSPIPLIESIRSLPSSKIFHLTQSNRDSIYEEIKTLLISFVK